MDPVFTHDAENRLFIADVDGTQATILYARAGQDLLDFQSTYVPHVLRNKSLGTQLVHYALGWAKSHGLRVIPSCWFVKMIMDRDAVWDGLKPT